MNDQAAIEQDLDSADRLWMADHAWRIDDFGVSEYKGRIENGFVIYVHQNPLLVSILTFIIGGIAFYIFSSIL